MKCDFRATTAARSAKRMIELNIKTSAKSCGERESRKKRKRKRTTRGTEGKKDNCQTGDDCSGKMNSLKITEVD